MRVGITRTEFIRLIKGKIRFNAFKNHYCMVLGVDRNGKTFKVADGYFNKDNKFILIDKLNPYWWKCDRFIVDTVAVIEPSILTN